MRGRTRWLAVALLPLGVACHSVDPFLEDHQRHPPGLYLTVTTASRASHPRLAEHEQRQRDLGLEVRTVVLDPSVPVAERYERLRAQLAEHRPAEGQRAYALLLLTSEELPVPAWPLEGLEEEVSSDLPLFLSSEPEVGGAALTEEVWSEAFRPDFPWITGRIPFEDDVRLAAALGAPAPDRSPPVALLGAERHMVWSDASQVMNRAKDRLRRAGWRATLLAEDWPCDSFLDQERPAAFVGEWARQSPDVVYLSSHGSSLFGIWIGHCLLADELLEQHRQRAAAAAQAPRPERPALLIVGACQAGDPDAGLTRRLFHEGWVHSMVASTASTDPTPLLPAIRAQLHVADALTTDLTAGQCLQALRESYYDDAGGGDPASVGRNLLGLTLYGDPAHPVRGPREVEATH